MRNGLIFLGLAALAIFAFGCIQPVQKLGCCLKENLTEGCVLYNTTDFLEYDFRSATNGPCDSNDTAYNTTGHCNVTVGDNTYLIPVCTQEDKVPCVSQDCTAMVCGDFAYKPRAAPGFKTTGGNVNDSAESNIEGSEGNVPPETEEGGAAQFYKAQCRYLPMDAKLRQIMKNSQSQINVFRVGVGGSFDEYDQYKNFFPLSDKYCNINPPSAGAEKVDRYTNYLTSTATTYDPNSGITQNCLVDSGSSPFGTPNPFGFTEGTTPKSAFVYLASATYNPVLPDQSNYKMAHHAREDWIAHWNDWGGYYYSEPVVRQDGVYKKVDDAFYRKSLSIAHAETIYGLSGSGSTRAPFECDARANECYSGACDTQVYNRGVLLTFPGLQGGDEVVADCNKVSNELGQTIVVCAPTKNVTTNPGGAAPTIGSATVDVIPQHLELDTTFNFAYDYEAISQDEELFDPFWDTFDDSQFAELWTGATRTTTNHGFASFYITERKNCDIDWPGVEDDDESDYDDEDVLCSSYGESFYGPPVGGAVFFGKQGEEEVKYKDNTIIGYAIASPSEFDDMYFVKNCQINVSNATETNDYVRVELTSLGDADWDELRTAFKPYFKERMKAIKTRGFDDGCGDRLQTTDAVISSMPWVLDYRKGIRDEAFIGDDDFETLENYMSSTSAQALRSRNIYDEFMTSTAGTSSCELRRSTLWWIWGFGFDTPNTFYDLAFSKYIYLFKYDGDQKIGECSVDDSDLLPTVRTYGWCQSCTTSTLAFQSITAYDRVYMPAYTANVEDGFSKNLESICEAQYKPEWEGFFDVKITDNVSCFNPRITDVNEYKDSIASIGSPRTSPEATIIKERIGNYMKAGVMPVFDMTDASNWKTDNPDAGDEDFFLFWVDDAAEDYYQQLDFQRLFGNMGASVVIVDHVSGNADFAKVEQIINRSSLVRERCFGCLTAFHVDSPSSNTSFNDSLNSVLSDPRANFAVDMVTFDYPVSSHSSVYSGAGGAENRSQLVAADLASYGRMALQSRGKPTMVVGFNVRSDDGYWNSNNYNKLFETIVTEQDDLVKAGISGIIYSPARESGDKGLVQVSAGVGQKTQKFCAFQGAMLKMSSGAPVALFNRINAVDAQNCTKCSSLDKAVGPCSDSARLIMDPRTCDNGVLCTVPDGLDEDEARCPQDTVIDAEAAGEECTLCNETGGSYTCTFRYSNGTEEDVGPLPMSEISSDIYMDIIGGLSRPDKCCLLGPNGKKYTFVKQTFQNRINKPVVFPKRGDPNVDCGIGDPSVITELSSFCGIQLPLREYDLNCSVS